MSVGSSNVMPGGSSSSSTSSSSAVTKVGELIKEFNKTTITSFVIGISKLPFHSVSKNFSHTSLFLSNKKRGLLKKSTEGILIEYGSYPPDEEKAKKEEEDYIKNEHVIYRYGEKEGGIRYYTNTYKEFIDKFCDIGYILLNLNKDKEMSFSYFIENIAPIAEKKWTKNNYKLLSFNCQTFTNHCIDKMQPEYENTFIVKGKNSQSISDFNKEIIVPSCVLETLQKHEVKEEDNKD